MLTLPKVVERQAQPYVAVRRRVTIPFGDIVGPAMGALFDAIAANGLEPDGPVFFKYNIVNMPDLEIDFAVPVAAPFAGDDVLVGGVVPAGRYAELTYWGHYDNLIDANAVLIGWAKQREIAWDSTTGADGEHFVARLESYPNSPEEEPDPEKWETTVRIKVRD